MKRTLTIITFLLMIISCNQDESYVRKQLPKSASEIQEYYNDTGMSGDYVRVLKAKIDKSSFHKYASRLKLNSTYSELKNTLESETWKMDITNPPSWWTEPNETELFYLKVDRDKEFIQRLKWKNGYMYLITVAW